ncbi:protein of unknown function [endosymbiont DhMRE of Dentiscutata heterogama]|uniref:hypothetical protein n=1 Tax=endosymbiont DhMRE of Dentiscutata heterogama TaxID=1609546 RepID=UPI000629DB06|nr:hypothetical protein [endosymbiont DhMRE of Dentiscutata heterogama]CFW93329.1 protein of unknown function [endosymbiont DhMRE of Dentiscutata heterogama]
MTETFKCSWCKHSHDISELEAVGENKRAAETYLEAKKKYEDKRSELPFRNDLNEEEKRIKDHKYQNLIRKAWEELSNLKDIWICTNCLSSAKKKAHKSTGEDKVYTCAVCKNTIRGKPHKVHIANKISIGIDPRRIAKVCEGCWENEIIPADLYCPRTSDGRDTWNPGESKYDCLCVDKPKYKGGKYLDQRNYHYEERDKDLEG